MSTTGSDAADGLSLASAWQSIDNGDATGVLLPGDTVRIGPGTYNLTESVELTSSGTADSPIVYRCHNKGRAQINLNNSGKPAIVCTGDYIELHHLAVTNADEDGIRIEGDSCLVTRCYVHSVSKIGLRVKGSYNTFLRNIIYQAGDEGIKNEDAGEFQNLYYHNVVSDCGTRGIELQGKVKTARIINNIVVENADKGIKGPVEAVCAFNNVWGNPGGNYDGVVDSAGGISKIPKFLDPDNDLFNLTESSYEIDAGMDLGYTYAGAAPDMGAYEKNLAYYVSPTGDDDRDGLSWLNAWASIDNGDSTLYPGDTVYIAPGVYTGPVVINDNGASSDRINYVGVRDSTFVDGSGLDTAVTINGGSIRLSGLVITGAAQVNISITNSAYVIDSCRISRAGRYGLYAGQAGDLFGNVFSENDSVAVMITSGSDGHAFQNTFYENGFYGYVTGGSSHELINNIFQGHDSAAIYGNTTSQVTYSLFYGNGSNVAGGSRLGLYCQTDDPLMADPAAGDFALRSNSPAIDAGADLGESYNGSAPDLGAYETEALVSLQITPHYDSMFVDSVYAFDVIALDADSNDASPGDLTWSHTFSAGDIDAAGVFTPDQVDTGRIIVESSINGITDTSALMTVAPGVLAALVLTPDRDTVSADSTRQFTVTGRDSKGNEVLVLGNIVWSVMGGIGSIDNTGLFDAGRIGDGFVIAASDLGPSAISDTITVVPGEIAYLDVAPDDNTISEAGTQQYGACARDADSNIVIDVTDSVSWSTTDPSGSVTAGGLYTSGTDISPPDYYVRAEYQGLYADSGLVTVISSGLLSYVRIETIDGTPLGDTSLTTDNDSTVLYCRGYDSGDTPLGDFSAIWSVLGADSIGAMSDSSGTSSSLVLYGIGLGQIEAVAGSLADTSGTITCLGGEPVSLVISPDSALLSADSSLQFSAVSLDADGHPSLPAVTPDWSVIGAIGTITSPGGLFDPTTVGTGRIVASGSGLTDTTEAITVEAGNLAYIEVLPDSVIVSAGTTQQFEAVGHDADGNHRDAGSITWGITSPLGTIDTTGLFDAVTTGQARVTAISGLGPVDSSSFLEVVAGELTVLTIAPDSVDITTDSTAAFTVSGFDANGNPASIGNISWSLINDIGDVSPEGVFIPLAVGADRVIATSSPSGIVDTNDIIVVSAGQLHRINIVPDEASVIVGDSIQFTVSGYDASFSPAEVGEITWSVVGEVGTIDTSGWFHATASGTGRVAAVSSINGISDTTAYISVEALHLNAIALGNGPIYPNSSMEPILAFEIGNAFTTDRQVQSISLHDGFRGIGLAAERRTDVDSVSLYLDQDNDSTLTPADQLLASAEFATGVIDLMFAPVTIPAGASRMFLVGLDVALYPHDGDTLDVWMVPSEDVQTVDGVTIESADTVNSWGYRVIDGLVADQIPFVPTGLTEISPVDTVVHLLTLDIPRNGYREDTLRIFNLVNRGTADQADIDSLILYEDDGNGAWDGAEAETRVCRLYYTGNLWTRSGLSSVLLDPTARFHVGAAIAEYPTNGATLALTVPVSGLQMSSSNDGPTDASPSAADTTTIITSEALTLEAAAIPGHRLTPGAISPPLTGINLTNRYLTTVGLDSLRLTVYADGDAGGSQVQFDSQFDSILLYVNRDGDHSTITGADSLLASATITDGEAVLATPGLNLAGGGGYTELSIVAAMNPDNCRDANTINIGLADSTGVYLSSPGTLDSDFPLKNGSEHIIDIFPGAAVGINMVEGVTLYGAQTNQLVLDFELPRNGYASDVLHQIMIRNIGTVRTVDALAGCHLYSDNADDGYTGDDPLVGSFAYSNGSWVLTNIGLPLTGESTRLSVVVDITSDQSAGGTLQFQIPVDGVRYQSGVEGPDDIPVGNPEAHLVFPSNRVTAISIPDLSQPTFPGSTGNLLMSYALYNGYVGQERSLKSVAVTNRTRTASSTAFADGELGQVSLYYDSDNNRVMENDSLVASGYFSDGRLVFSGVDVTLPPESLSYFFIVADLPLNCIDSDSLSVSIEGPSDFGFAEETIVNGDLPLSGGGFMIIDGSVSDQYELGNLVPRTLRPGDTSVTLFAFRPAINGDQTDTLESVTIANLLDAASSDIEPLDLWLDTNGDGVWQVTDRFLVTAVFGGGGWSATGLQVEVSAADRPTILAVGDVKAAAAPGASFRGALPENGCLYASGNDGPVDIALEGNNTFTVSNSGLRVSFPSLGETYSVGQTVDVRFITTNAQTVTMDDVSGQIVAVSDPSLVAAVDSIDGPVSLPPGDSAEFSFRFTALQPGEVSWQLRAVAPSIPDSSAVVQTNTVSIQAAPSTVEPQLVNSIPTAVTRGQANVFPMTVNFAHPDQTAGTASLRLDSLRLFVEDGGGNALNASDVFSRLVLASGTGIVSVIDNVPAQPDMKLSFSTPVIVPPGSERSFTLLVNIDSTATASDFALAVVNPAGLPIVDANTLQPVTIDPGVVWPMKTASCRIENPSREGAVSYVPLVNPEVNYGQSEVPLLQLNLRHPGETGSSQIQLTKISFSAVNDSGEVFPASALFEEIELRKQQSTLASAHGLQLDDTLIGLPLSSPLTLSPGQSDSVSIVASLKTLSPVTGFSLQVGDSTLLVIRDVISGFELAVVTDQLATSTSAFPASSGPARVRQPATAPEVCIQSLLPASTIGGLDSLSLVEYRVDYNTNSTSSAIRLDWAGLVVLDNTGTPLDPTRLFDRIGYSIEGGPVVYLPYVQMLNGASLVDLSGADLLLAPGDSLSLQVVADIEADVPYDNFQLHARLNDALTLCDATDTSRSLGIMPMDVCAGGIPYSTGVTEIYLAAGRPGVRAQEPSLLIASPGDTSVPVFEIDLSYDSETPQGDLSLSGIRGRLFRRTASGLVPAAGSEVLSAVTLLIDGAAVATDTLLAGDSIICRLDSGFTLSRGTSFPVALVCDIRSDVGAGNYVLRFDDSTFVEVADKNLSGAVYPTINDAAYPILSDELSIAAAGLESSFTNYPNPFNPALGEVTTIGYTLDEPARVDIELFSITGEAVKDVLTDAYRGAGAHQSDIWSGTNGKGQNVVPGTYFCRLTVRYASGRTETLRRKIAVVR